VWAHGTVDDQFDTEAGVVRLKTPIRTCALRSDATNSGIWNNSKLHNTEVVLAYVAQLPAKLLDDTAVADHAHKDAMTRHAAYWRTFADILPVADSSGAASALALARTQLCMFYISHISRPSHPRKPTRSSYSNE
jgi:hypothetical protein